MTAQLNLLRRPTVARRGFLSGAALLAAGLQTSAIAAHGDAESTSAAQLTAKERLRAAPKVSVADYIPAAIWAGMNAGTIVDVTEYVQGALDACPPGSSLHFPFCASGYLVSNPAGSLEKIFTLPIGVNVLMDDGAWIYPSTANAVTTVFTPLGSNILRVNIDGRSLPEEVLVGQSPGEDRSRGAGQTWINYSFGVRAYATPDLGHGASSVTVFESRFRNLTHAIQTQGSSYWTIVRNRFERIELAAVIMGYIGGDSRHNTVEHNEFDSIGDCAVAWHSSGEPVHEAAYNSQSFNQAVDTNLNVQGFAFNVEPHNPDQQHHFRMIGNSVRQLTTGLPHGTGGCTMQNVSDSVMAFNTLHGSLNSNGDYGISCLESRRMQVVGNQLANFRGAGITVDGSADSEVKENIITDCGEGSSGTVFPGIRIGLHYQTSGLRVRDNKILYTPGYAHGAATCNGISLRTSGGAARGITLEGNAITSPWGSGIFLAGLPEGGRVSGLNLINNRIRRTDPASIPATPIQVYSAAGVTISGSLFSGCAYGYVVQSCADVMIEDGQVIGASPILTLYDFTDSTDVVVRNMRCAAPVVTAVAGAGARTVWENDDQVSPAA